MEIKLVKTEVVDFKLNEENCKEFDFNDLLFIAGCNDIPYEGENGPRYVVFKTRNEFFMTYEKYDIDRTKKVLINDKGYFFCPLKNSITVSESKEVINESANTKEDKTE